MRRAGLLDYANVAIYILATAGELGIGSTLAIASNEGEYTLVSVGQERRAITGGFGLASLFPL